MLPDKVDTIIVGGGAAGMMAAVSAALSGDRVLLIEKNEKTGKKLYITGKGRCNFTNACEIEDIFAQVVTNAKFLYSCIYGFSNHDVIERFQEWGLPVREERGGRMFPASDKSSDVIRMLNRRLLELDVEVSLNTEVEDLVLTPEGDRVLGVRLRSGGERMADRVILATGGISYPSTGSTGDGYRMAEELGHSLVRPRPGLTGIATKETLVRKMQGLTLINTAQTIWDRSGAKEKKLLEGFGEILFTHFGVSGPTILTASSRIGDILADHPLVLVLDIKPGLDRDQLDARLLRDIREDGKKAIGNLLRKMLPKSLIPVILEQAGIEETKRSLDLTREERLRLVGQIKEFTLTLTGVRRFEEAIITRGGISVKEVNPQTMESKLVSGLYFAGEILDVDALTGGYNLQIAWSTGFAAGRRDV